MCGDWWAVPRTLLDSEVRRRLITTLRGERGVSCFLSPALSGFQLREDQRLLTAMDLVVTTEFCPEPLRILHFVLNGLMCEEEKDIYSSHSGEICTTQHCTTSIVQSLV